MKQICLINRNSLCYPNHINYPSRLDKSKNVVVYQLANIQNLKKIIAILNWPYVSLHLLKSGACYGLTLQRLLSSINIENLKIIAILK